MSFDINKKFNDVILASKSPRRIDMLRNYGLDPVIIPPKCNEDLPQSIEMQDAVMLLALKKALWVEEFIKDEDIYIKQPLIIAADTVVFHEQIIGKPQDREDALRILSALSGTHHFVATGVALIVAGTSRKRVFYNSTKVFFKGYSPEDLSSYLDSDEPYDKAGAYAIQGTFSKYTDYIEGDLNNVIGLPLAQLMDELGKL